MPSLTIDGREVTVPEKTNLIEAAHELGIEIPRFCYHPDLSIAANCRMCLVEVEKMPKPVPACQTIAQDKMVVQTDNEHIRDLRRRILELVLINHPVDCPICDQAGECDLQDYFEEHGIKVSRLSVGSVHKRKAQRLGSGIVYDAERCVLCTRCVRFFEEKCKIRPLGVFHRGEKSEVGIYPGQPIDSIYAGNIADNCPVGALTNEEFRFKCRSWFLARTPSICPGCARGCNVYIDHFRNEVQRLQPRENKEVNKSWMCDLGRAEYRLVHEKRVLTPALRKGDELVESTLEESLQLVSQKIAEILEQHGSEAIGVVLSPRATVEENFAMAELASKHWGTEKFFMGGRPLGAGDDFLLNSQRNPNGNGVRLAAGVEVADSEELATALGEGLIRAMIVLGSEMPSGTAVADLARTEFIVALAAHEGPVIQLAHVILPKTTWAEHDGVFVNFEGRAQRVRQSILPLGAAIPVWKVASRLACFMGYDYGYDSAEEAWKAVAAKIEFEEGKDYKSLGDQGVMLKG